MSWSVSIIGKPKAIAKELDAYSLKYKEQSSQTSEEFEKAKPHIQALLELNFAGTETKYSPSNLHLKASGHRVWAGGTDQHYGSFQMSIETIGADIV